MLGNSFLEYFEKSCYKFLPETIIKIRTNGRKVRTIQISEGGGYHSSSKGIICYSGKYLDNGECFIEMPEILILKKMIV